jgi:hypothetical protein
MEFQVLKPMEFMERLRLARLRDCSRGIHHAALSYRWMFWGRSLLDVWRCSTCQRVRSLRSGRFIWIQW